MTKSQSVFGTRSFKPTVTQSPQQHHRREEGSDSVYRMAKRVQELGSPTPGLGKSPSLKEDNPLSKRLSRRKLTERGASFIDSDEEARERARANRSKPVLAHKRNEIGEQIYKSESISALPDDILS